jgi:hypothetical protein
VTIVAEVVRSSFQISIACPDASATVNLIATV